MQTVDLKGARLSLQQNRLWSFLQEGDAYRVQTAIWLNGKLDETVLLQALQQVIERYEILHTVFYMLPGMDVPVQVVGHDSHTSYSLINLEGLNSSIQQTLLDGNFSFLQTQPFDLAHGPLLRTLLFRLSAEKHQLLVSASALCADAATLPLLITQLLDTYEATLQGRQLDEEPLQYATVSAWQNELLEAEEAKDPRDFWKQFDLRQATQTRLPFTTTNFRQGRLSTSENMFALHVCPVAIDETLAARVHALAARYEISLPTLFLACWQVVLRRLIDDDTDLTVGVACDGRDYEELADALGLYTRFVPVSSSFGKQWTLEQVLAAMEQSLQAAVEWQSYFTWSSEDNTISMEDKTQYFPLAFEYQNWSVQVPTGDMTVSLHQSMHCTEPFILKLHVLQNAEQMQVAIQYDPRYVHDEHANRLSRAFQVLLSDALERPQTQINALHVLSLDEQKQLRTQFCAPLKPLPAYGFHRLFEQQAKRVPQQLALVSNTKHLTYQELNSQANQLAHVLRRYGVGPNVLVGLCLPRSEEMIIAILAIFKAGGGYVPLDPESPSARLVHQLNAIQTPFLLTGQALASQLPQWHGQTVYIEELCNGASQEDINNLSISSDPGDSAYIIYTSGSTGQPKGVIVCQESIVNYTIALCELLQVEPGWNFATVSTLAADLGNTAIFCALASGGCLHILDYDTITSAEAFTRRSDRYPIDVLKIVPSHLAALLNGEHARGVLPRRALVPGGEALPYSLIQRVWELGATCKVYNHYGPTETTIGVLVNELEEYDGAETAHTIGSLPLGKPIANTDVYVLDTQLHIVPIGVVGELYIGGVGLANGYLHQSAQTAERFIPHPFSEQAGARLYRSGDLVRYTAQGQIEFVGRRDSQVKLRGYRIELGEIETMLKQHPNIWDCTAILWEDGEAISQLIAYVVARKHPAPGLQELSNFLRERLPGYMIPTIFMPLKILPLTANGKVDRRHLPRPELQPHEAKSTLTPPRSPIEEILLHIWRDLLAVPEMGIHDNFFQVGGHSLLATQVISRVLSVIHVELSIQSLFKNPTVAELARCIEDAIHGQQADNTLPLTAVTRPENVPLSFAQQRLWFLDQLEPASTAYLIPRALCIHGALDRAVLEQSLSEVVRRHESLRTTFIERAGQPVQVIHSANGFHLPVVDLRELAQEEREHEALRLAQQEAELPFALRQDPLFRAYLLTLADHEYVLLLTMHHIISDGWSNGVFVREFTTLYSAFSAGRPSPLAPLPLQYADFAIWQRNWLREERLTTQLTYWQQQLDGIVPLALSTDYPRPPLKTYRGASLSARLPLHLRDELSALSQRENVTLFMLLLAAFQVLLARYTGQYDISVGTPIANRTRAELEELIGFFVNTLVLRTDLSGNPSFIEVLQRVRDVALGAYAHQDMPFEQLVDTLQPERDLSRSPLFQVMFAMQQAVEMPEEDIELTVDELDTAHRTTKFDLTLNISNAAEEWQCKVEYNTDLFEASTIQRLLEHWQILLQGIVTAPQKAIADLPLLSATEQRLLLDEWASTQFEEVGDACLHTRFEEQVAHAPDAVALVYEDEHFTYDHLNSQANQLAHTLRQAGVETETIVGVILERSPWLSIALLAVLKAGAAYLPLDPSYPTERLAFMLDDAHVSLVLTQQTLLERLPVLDGQVIYLDRDWSTISRAPRANLPTTTTSSHLAYVIYTSGSTGLPKGVMVTHHNVLRLFAACQPFFSFHQQDSWTLFHSYAFDFSVWELWGAWLHGGRLVLVPYHVSRSPELFYALLCQCAVTVLNQTPSAFRQLLPVDALNAQTAPLALRWIIFGGEALDLSSLRPWFERHGEQRPQLINMYGITETTVHVTYRPLRLCDTERASDSVIGRPLLDLQVYLLDQHLQPVPIGVPGEMYVGGAGVAQGYLHRPALSGERFIAHPFSQQPGMRLYKTGDLARYLPNGELVYLGRIDQQVKVRGFRIELGEVEAQLAQHPGVQQCVVMVREDQPSDKRLVAYIVPAHDTVLDNSELRRFLQEKLPDYMLPTAFVLLSEFPLTSHGKINRQALPAPHLERSQLAAAYMSPRTATEEILAGIWEAALGVEQVGIHDNFFATGGDSIRSIKVLAQARERGLHFSLQQLFQHQTIHELSQILADQDKSLLRTGSVLPFSLITEEDRKSLPAEVEDAYPLTRLQLGMLFHGQYSSISAVYHNINSYCLRVAYDGGKLRQVLEQLIQHHPVLRTSFDLASYSQPLQLVHQDVTVPLEEIDLSHLPAAEQEEFLATWFEQEKQHPFHWSQPPLWRIYVHRRGSDTFQFSMVEHHAILDGWSVASFLTELFKLYMALLQNETFVCEPAPAVQFRLFVALEHQLLNSQTARQYWQHTLQESTNTHIPRWITTSRSEQPSSYDNQRVPITTDLAVKLKQLARECAVPLKSVLLAAHLRVLNLVTGQADILTGLVSNSRPETTDGERVLGLFLNTIPFRLQLTGGTWRELIQQTFAAECKMLPHRGYPLSEIQKQQGGQELFETAFNYTHFHVYQGLTEIEDVTNSFQVVDQQGFEQTNFTLVAKFSSDPFSSEVHLALQCNTPELSREQVEAIQGYYTRVLTEMVEQPEERYEWQSLLTEQERQQILFDWNATGSEYDREICVHNLLEEQAKQAPESIAVVFEDEHLTYAELNRRANRLARHLQEQGVGPETLVGVCIEPSLELITGLLAVLKAGGAYVPLSPSAPFERQMFQLEDACARLLLTQSHLATRFIEARFPVVCLDTFSISQGEGFPDEQPPICHVDARNLAYVIYTSGSTGIPKGVCVTHRSLLNLISWHQHAFAISSHDRATQIAELAFDASVWEIWPYLTAGASLHFSPADIRLSPVELRTWFLTHAITISFLPTPLAEPMLDTIWPEDMSLRVLLTGGDRLNRYANLSYPFTFVNNYGPTENTVVATYTPVSSQRSQASPPIGRPITNVSVYVLDPQLQPVPIGTPGELYIGGEGLARCYLNRLDLTAERFIPDPFSAKLGTRLYRTGDLTRFLPDGNLEYLGRADSQVKIHGYRIELGEIEAILGQHPAISECVVHVQERTAVDKYLVAYIVGKEQIEMPGDRLLRDYLLQKLPAYMIPAFFVPLKKLPLTSNGKVDRRALPAPERNWDESDQELVAPRTALEAQLVQIWSEVLGQTKMSIHDDFFALRGDSILSIQVVARANQLGLHLTAKQIFLYPTIAQLASVIETSGETPIQQEGPVTGSVPLTPIQQWFFDWNLPEKHHFNQALLLEANEPLQPGILYQSFWHLLNQHDALRLRFVCTTSGWQQHYTAHTRDIPFLYIDLSHIALEQQDSIIEILSAASQASLHLENGPLLHCLYFKRGPLAQDRLLVLIHHLIVDGVSWRILLTDIEMSYLQLQRGEQVRLPTRTTSFQRWAQKLQHYAQSPALQQEARYWLAPSRHQVAPLPVDAPTGLNTRESTKAITVELSARHTQALLQEVPPVYHTQINDVLLTALVQAFARWTGQRRLVVNLEGHGREEILEDVDISRTAGWFTTIFPVLLDIEQASDAGHALRIIKEQLRQIPQHGIGYGILRYMSENTALHEQLAALPPAQVSFNYLGQFDPLFAGLSLLQRAQGSSGPVSSSRGERIHLLDISGFVEEGRMRFTWQYSEHLYHRETIKQLAEHFLSALEEIIAYCQLPEAGGYTPSDFPLAKLEQSQLDGLLQQIQRKYLNGEGNQIEEIYPLSPLQAGLLFHSLYAPETARVYFAQIGWSIQGALDTGAWQRAWQHVVDRHAILRTLFLWEGLAQPLQVVLQKASVPWKFYDWQDLPEQEQREKLEALHREDWQDGFDLGVAPLLRLKLVRLGRHTFYCLLSEHHLLLDGWSQQFLFKEVMTCYLAYCKGREPVLATPRPYRDYIAWLQRQDSSQTKYFWEKYLAGFTTPTVLAVDQRSLMKREHSRQDMALEYIQISAEATTALQRLAQWQKVTMNTIVQGAWALLLARYSGQEEVTFGAVVSGRSIGLAGVESMVGLFINTMPVRVKIEPAQSLVHWLAQLQAQQVEVRQYEYTPLVEIQRWSEIPTDQLLFESLLVFQNFPLESMEQERESSLEIRAEHVVEHTNYPLSLLASARRETISLQISYDTARFDELTIKRLAKHLQMIVESMALQPQRALASLPLLTEAERHQLLIEWNATQRSHQDQCCMHDLFEQRALAAPDAIALAYEEEQLTYAALNQRANQVAHCLQRLGIGPEKVVGICLPRSVEFVVGLLGTLKAGGAYLPIEPSYPHARLLFMLNDAHASVLLTLQSLQVHHPTPSIQMVCLDTDWRALSQESTTKPVNQVRAANLAYIIYTSGSTGQPKGAMVTQKGMLNHLYAKIETLDLSSRDRVAQTASHCFDISVWQFFAALLQGGRVCIYPDEVTHDPLRLFEQIATRHNTILEVVPSLLHTFLDVSERSTEWKDAGATLRWLIATGEQLSASVGRHWMRRYPHVSLLNAYGPTECSDDVTHARLSPAMLEGATSAPIGQAIINTQIYLLDEALQPVPVGVPGEIYVGGLGVGRGYIGDPVRTASVFLPDPFGQSGSRLYKTGDVGRYHENGQIEFLRRVDQQVKIRGYRIELGEIEAVLAQHSAIRESVVLVREDTPRNHLLVAYVVSRESKAILSSDQLRHYLRERLPSYMVPDVVMLLDTLPLTSNGKVNRRALPAPIREEMGEEEGMGMNITPIEELLLGIWTEILGQEQISIHDNFFELGGHSLLATQLVSRLRMMLRAEIQLRDVFEAPTIVMLARRITQMLREKQGVQMPPLVPVARGQKIPLSFAQQRLWFLDQLEPGSTAYLIPHVHRFAGVLEVQALEKSLVELIQRHESLRTTFQAQDGSPVQIINPTGTFCLPVIDLRGVESEARERETRELIRQEALQPCDLARGPLLRISLVRIDENDHVLLLTMHHIIADGWSIHVLVQELTALYHAFVACLPSPLPPLPIQYADFAFWQRQWLQGEVLEAQLDFWTARLGGAPQLKLPVDHSYPPVPSRRGAIYRFTLPSELYRSLMTLSHQEGVTLFMTLLAAFQTLLYRYTGQEDIVLGTDSANRNRVEIEKLIGFFINILVLRTDLSGTPTFREVLHCVRERVLEAYTYQETPFELLVEKLAPAHTLERMPLVQALFVLQNFSSKQKGQQNFADATEQVDSVVSASAPLQAEVNTAKFDLALFMQEQNGHLGGTFNYSLDLFETSTIATLAARFETLLRSIVLSPDSTIGRLDFLTEEERLHSKREESSIRQQLSQRKGERFRLPG